MRAPVILALAAALGAPAEEDDLAAALLRVSEEAEVFRVTASRIVARETLRQRARMRPSRFRIRVGEDALAPPKPRYQEREIISEYGFAVFAESPDNLHEVREVIAVDGKPVRGDSNARERLTLGLASRDDALKRKLLRRFESYGLVGAMSDFGQLLLLFRRENLPGFHFERARQTIMGAEDVQVIRFSQREGPQALTVFEGNRAVQARLEGELWVRLRDGLPLRITLSTGTGSGESASLHEAVVDYSPSSHGLLLPAAVQYRQTASGQVLIENVSHYNDFQMFAVDTEIKFSPLEAEAGASPPA